MDNKLKMAYIIGIIVVIILVLGGITVGLHIGKNNEEVIDGGVVKNGRLKGYKEKINSKDIISFSYSCGEYEVSCELKNNKLTVKSSKTEYISKDNSLLKDLQKIIEKYNISKNNGYVHEVAGLPPGYGGTISVIYNNKEKIYKYDNQTGIIPEEAEKEIYNAFYKDAKDNGYDLKEKVVEETIDESFLQGTWSGTHFGKTYKVIFNDNNIKIYEDDVLTDDTNYKIVDGDIVRDNDDKEFKVISLMKKKNDFTLVAYFMKESYSTCDLLRKE